MSFVCSPRFLFGFHFQVSSSEEVWPGWHSPTHRSCIWLGRWNKTSFRWIPEGKDSSTQLYVWWESSISLIVSTMLALVSFCPETHIPVQRFGLYRWVSSSLALHKYVCFKWALLIWPDRLMLVTSLDVRAMTVSLAYPSVCITRWRQTSVASSASSVVGIVTKCSKPVYTYNSNLLTC